MELETPRTILPTDLASECREEIAIADRLRLDSNSTDSESDLLRDREDVPVMKLPVIGYALLQFHDIGRVKPIPVEALDEIEE